MPRVVRDYKKQDFSYLLNELQGSDSTENIVTKQKYDRKLDNVSQAKRRRSSLTDNSKMLYAYSSRQMILHDRDCDFVKDIPDEAFCMSSEFIKNMKICPLCYRRVLIRAGLGEDRRHIYACERFFNQLEVSNNDLYSLLIKNKATIKWINNDTVQIRFNEDTWRIIRGARGLELWHNNYICLDDFSRHFTEGFHKQSDYDFECFHFLLKAILNYSWESHIAMFEESKKKDESDANFGELNNCIAENTEKALYNTNFFRSIFQTLVKRLKICFNRCNGIGADKHSL